MRSSIFVAILFSVCALSVANAFGDSCTFASGVSGSCSVSGDPGVTATGTLNLVSSAVPNPTLALADYPQYQNLGFTTAYGLTMSLTISGQSGQNGTFNAQFTLPAEYGNWVIYGNLGYNYADSPNENSNGVINGFGYNADAQEVEAYLIAHSPGDPMTIDATITTSANGTGPVNATLYLELLGDAPASVPEPALWPVCAILLLGLFAAQGRRLARKASASFQIRHKP